MKSFALLLGGVSAASSKATSGSETSIFDSIPLVKPAPSTKPTSPGMTLQLERVADHKSLVADEVLRAKLQNLVSLDDSGEEITVCSVDGLNFFTHAYLGSNGDKVKMAISTQTPASFVSAAGECTGCNEHQKGYYYHSSKTLSKVSNKPASVSLGREQVRGVLVQDSLSLQEPSTESNGTAPWGEIDNFPFLLVNQWNQSRFQEVDGVLSLAKHLKQDQSSPVSKPNFMDYLVSAGEISRKVFGIHFDHIGGSSLELGSFSLDNVAPGVPLVKLDSKKGEPWQFEVEGIRVTDKNIFPNGAVSLLKVPKLPAYLDTFSPFISVPKSYSAEIFSKFFRRATYESLDSRVLVGPCDLSMYDPISLFVNDQYYLRMQPESFVIDIGYSDRCFIAVQTSSDDYWKLGEPFFRNFYAVFDEDEETISLGPSKNFPMSTIRMGEAPTHSLDFLIQKQKEKQAQGEKNMPDLNNPLSVASYMIKKAANFIFGGSDSSSGGNNSASPSNDGSQSSPASDSESSSLNLSVPTIITIVVVLVSLVLCVGGIVIYIVIQFNNGGFGLSKGTAPDGERKQMELKSKDDKDEEAKPQSRPIVQSSAPVLSMASTQARDDDDDLGKALLKSCKIDSMLDDAIESRLNLLRSRSSHPLSESGSWSAEGFQKKTNIMN